MFNTIYRTDSERSIINPEIVQLLILSHIFQKNT